MQISNCKSHISNLRFEIRNLKSHRRRGVSILEVLFAILVTTVGLLGALAVLPVASTYARKGRTADAVAVAGHSAVHRVDTMGMRRPDMWVGWNQSWEQRASPPAPGPSFQSLTAIQTPNGTSLCIDPRFVAINSGSAATANPASLFPYVPRTFATEPRMFRVGLTNGLPSSLGGTLMTLGQANSIFVINDDISFERPGDRSMPAQGLFRMVDHDNDGPTGTPGIPRARQNGGHMSWIATLVPKHELYASIGPSGAVQNDLYVLSVVVFYDRPLVNFSIDTPGTDMRQYSERVVDVDFTEAGGLGYAGGEALLIWPIDGGTATLADLPAAKEALKVRAGEWIMLAGLVPHALGGVIPIFKWYRVTEVDSEPEFHTTEEHYELAVSLTGQDWDTATNSEPRAFIVSGVVGVYEKTVRLETGIGF